MYQQVAPTLFIFMSLTRVEIPLFVCPVVYFIPRVVLSPSAFCFPISFTLCVGIFELGILLLFLLVISI
jgi:hypothetical protein